MRIIVILHEMAGSIKWMPTHDDSVPGGPSGHDIDRDFGQLLEATEIGFRLLRQRRIRGGTGRWLAPTGHGLVDRLALSEPVDQKRRRVLDLAVEPIASADLDLGQAVEDVELRQAETGDAVREHRAPQQHGVEPTATPRPARRRAELVADRTQSPADVVVELGGERTRANARRVSLHDTEDVVDGARADAGACGGTADGRVRRSDERISAEID